MDQGSYRSAYDYDYFQNLHQPISGPVHDTHDLSRPQNHGADSPSLRGTKSHVPDNHDNLSLRFQADDSNHFDFGVNSNMLKNWHNSQMHNTFLDMTFDSTFGMDPFQIRSRAGSFNFGRFRKDSEDLFNLNSDFMRQMRNANDTRSTLENALLRKPVQCNQEQSNYSPKPHMEAPASFMDNAFSLNSQFQHGPNAHMFNLQNTMNNMQQVNQNMGYAGPAKFAHDSDGTGICATVSNTETTVATVDSEPPVVTKSKRGRKKRLLNDGSEGAATGNEREIIVKPSNGVRKPGRPKKVREEATINTKTEEGCNSNQGSVLKMMQEDKGAKRAKYEGSVDENIKRENIEVSTNASQMPKIEDSSYTNKSNPFNFTVTSSRPSGNSNGDMKQIFGTMGMFSNNNDMMRNSSTYSHPLGWMDNRRIGTLTMSERRVKIEKYLQKRKKRTWSRKINYDCRKRVADSRLRIKGRFVTRDQAFTLMEEAGIPFDPVNITNAEIKSLLTEKFGGRNSKRRRLEAAMNAMKKISSDSMELENPVTGIKRPNEYDLEGMDLEDCDDEEESEASLRY